MALKTDKQAQELTLSTNISFDCTGKSHFKERTMPEVKTHQNGKMFKH